VTHKRFPDNFRAVPHCLEEVASLVQKIKTLDLGGHQFLVICFVDDGSMNRTPSVPHDGSMKNAPSVPWGACPMANVLEIGDGRSYLAECSFM
jgi:hypothetical protein